MRRLLPVLFVAQFVALDAAVRGVALLTNRALFAGFVASIVFWLLIGSFAATTGTRALVAVVAAADVVAQAVFYRYYRSSVDAQVVLALLESWRDVEATLAKGIAPYCLGVALLTAVEYAVVSSFRESLALSRFGRLGLVGVLLAALALGPARAVAHEFSRPREEGFRTVHVGAVPSVQSALPSILVLLTESVRASDYCSAHTAKCAVAPEVDALVPDRISFFEMRSVSSYTAVSVGSILSGALPVGSHDEIVRTPLLFDFMKSLRHPSGALSVAYWSAQTNSMFERSDLGRTLDSFVTVSDLVGHAVSDEDEIIDQGVDRLLAARVRAEIEKLAVPLVAVAHFQGTHAPYFVDERDAPFRPFGHVVTWSGLPELHNAYLDAIHEQDKSIAGTIRAFLERVGHSPYVIFFTSDHGEAFGEHGAIHHGQNLYEEQIHVPAWIASGNGALNGEELSALLEYQRELVTHLDVLPTLLDAEGIGHAPSLGRARHGRSLIRPFRRLDAAVPVTNCTPMFRCPLDTWGVLGETRELTAQVWDSDWRCVDLAGAAVAPGDPGCEQLRAQSTAHFAKLPNGAPNRP